MERAVGLHQMNYNKQANIREFVKTLKTENREDVIRQTDFLDGHMYASCMLKHKEECIRAFQHAVGKWTDTDPALVCVQTWPVHPEVKQPDDVYVFHVRAEAPLQEFEESFIRAKAPLLRGKSCGWKVVAFGTPSKWRNAKAIK